MGLKSLLGLDTPFRYENAIHKYGLEQIANVMAIIVRAKFSQDHLLRANQVRQFLREEADAMHRAGGFAAKFAETLCEDESYYVGAMDEEAVAPIDYPGGPQQTLLKMTLDFIQETQHNSDLPARFRCAVVWEVGQVETALLTLALTPDQADMQKIMKLKRASEAADALLGKLMDKHHEYFKKFIR